MKWIKKWGIPLINWLFPHYCVVCGKRLPQDRRVLCPSCQEKMPRTRYHTWEENRMAKQFWGKFPTGHAAAWFFYSKDSSYVHMIHLFKYNGRQQLAFDVGYLMAEEMLPSGFFDGIDCIVPIPLHKKRFRERGYNQSELLARGVAAVTHISVICDAVERIRYTETQTHKTMQERIKNMEDVFRAKNVDQLEGKHVLLMDDVMTTSSTLTACADALKEIPNVKFSFLTVAIAGH